MRIFIKKIWNNEFYKGGFFLTTSAFIGNLLNYFFNILVGRTLGPQGFGEITTLFSYISLTSVPITILSTIIIQKISSAEDNKFIAARSIENYFLSKLKKWSVLIIILIFIIPFIQQITNLSTLSAYSLIPLILLSFLASFYGAALQGLRLFFLVSLITVLVTIIKLFGAILVASGIDGLTTIITFIFISNILGLILNIYFIRNSDQRSSKNIFPKINKRIIHIVLNKQFIITTISVVGITLFSTIDILYVKKFFSAEQAGIYSSWSLFAKLILYVIGPIFSVSFVFFSSKFNLSKQNKTLFLTIILLFFISAISYIFYSFFSLFVVNFFFGNKFHLVIPFLKYASFFGFFFATIAYFNNYFLAKKSYFSLTLALGIPIYIGLLFLIKKNLSSIIQLDIVFSVVITLFYFLGFLSCNRREQAEKHNKRD